MGSPVGTLKLKDLATEGGVAELAKQLKTKADPTVLERLRAVVAKVLAKHPDLAGTAVNPKPGLNNAFYNFDQKAVTTGLLDPDVLAHEMGHAQNTAEAKAYQTLLRSARGLSALNQTAALPVMLGMHAFLGDGARKDAVNTLAGVSAALAGPILMEEASASANAVMNSDDKLQTLKRVLPALGAHSVNSLLPALLYQIDAKL